MQFLSSTLLLSMLTIVTAIPQAPTANSGSSDCPNTISIIKSLLDDQANCKLDSCKIYSLSANDDCMALCVSIAHPILRSGLKTWVREKELPANMKIMFDRPTRGTAELSHL
ncbi:hypothetical protein CERZMDRAFT_89474 [Cercospora zeae-maydis SCOH1-5]|uniref:Uncharacterized protein n=1 Tax=Cercospora zeae-maydis SCOH1-5 TaxID=717836 RepID=A0A6A6EZ00_9PEZI|nr:hypothetical protein CERZMDRAFT_89474 [Cercospora zeae-maydis SCOH1-5]